MCGRYALTFPPAVIAERFGLAWAPDVPPHYNIAPSQTIPVVRDTGQGKELAWLKWGLIPWWLVVKNLPAMTATNHTVDDTITALAFDYDLDDANRARKMLYAPEAVVEHELMGAPLWQPVGDGELDSTMPAVFRAQKATGADGVPFGAP
jgi:hypothetical protein